MLSRSADAVNWMARLVERAENVARFVDVNLILTLELKDEAGPWEPIVWTTGDQDDFKARYGAPTRENVIHFLTFDTKNPNSILSCLFSARENARSIREIISSEMWEHINQSYLAVRDAATQELGVKGTHDLFTRVKRDSHLFCGIMDATMTHGEAWHFGNIGRHLERADKTSRILDVKYYILLPNTKDVGSPLDDLQWSALLRSASALEMYRKKRRRRITPQDVVAFLVLDTEFPRSIRYCLREASQSLDAVSATGTANAAQRALSALRSRLSGAKTSDLIQAGLHESIERLQDEINLVGQRIFETFFATNDHVAAVSGREQQ
jgi:uncharacterized alpha-E superfamily protein